MSNCSEARMRYMNPSVKRTLLENNRNFNKAKRKIFEASYSEILFFFIIFIFYSF